MCTSDNPTFLVAVTTAAALPSAFSFEETVPLSEQLNSLSSVQLNAIAQAPHSRATVKRSMSIKEWEDLKPLIQNVYLDKNKTFSYLAHILRTEYGFEPTKRQFSRKVEEWGFRKNVSQPERRRILQSLDRGMDQETPTVEDRRIGPGKLGNWRRRYRKEEIARGFIRTQPLSLAITPASQAFKTETRTQGEITPISAMQDVSEAPPIIEQPDKSSRMEDLDTLTPDPEYMDCDIWPFNWAAVDVPGSPGLSRLFNALEIECSIPVPSLSLDTRIPEESQYISDTEMLDLWNENNKSLLYELDLSCSLKQLDLIHAPPQGQTRALPRSDPKLAFCGWLGSPLNEICVFPTSPTKALYQPPSSRKPSWTALETQAAELRVRLCKLKPLFRVGHPRIIAMRGILAEIYIRQGSYQRAEKMCRRVLNAIRKSSGPTNLKTIAAGQKLIQSLIRQGQYLHAQTLLSKTHSTILKLVNPDHGIATEATFLMAWTAMNLNDNEKAEGLFRQVLQIRLNTRGPRSYETWISMCFLGFVLSKQQKNSESEKLLRTALQLHYEFAEFGVEEDICCAMKDLSYTLSLQGLYKESEEVVRRALERFEVSLGPEHPMILIARVSLARSIEAQGRRLENGDIYRNVLKQQSKLLGESHPNTLITAWHLALYLEKMECLEEAIIWHEKTFWGELETCGPDCGNTMIFCNRLGLCYANQGRYDDAIELYRQLVERIQAVKGNEHPAIAEVQVWIEQIQLLLEGEEDMSGKETDNFSGEGD